MYCRWTVSRDELSGRRPEPHKVLVFGIDVTDSYVNRYVESVSAV